MKRIFLSAVAAVLFSTSVMAEDIAITREQLPEKAQSFIDKYLPGKTISYAVKDNDWFDRDYKVVFADGSKVEFTRKGECKELRVKDQALPAGVLPEAVSTYISQRYPERIIKAMEYDRSEREAYEVKLDNGMELKFSSAGKFLTQEF